MAFLEKYNWTCGLLGYAEGPSEPTDHKSKPLDLSV